MRGSGKEPSIIGSTRCTTIDWTMLGILFVCCLIMTIIGAMVQRKEYAHKVAIGYEFVTGDFECTLKNAIRLPFAGFIIGFSTGLCGIGPGVMINAILLQLNVHPRVAGETGQLLGI